MSGYQVIVGLERKTGDLGILFPAGGQLHPDFADLHDLYRKHPTKKDEQGLPLRPGGYLCEKARIRSLRLRGVASDALWLPLDHIKHLVDIETLRVGDQITEFDGEWLCRKYRPPMRTPRQGQPGMGRDRTKGFSNFKEIGSTGQLRDNLAGLPEGAVIHVSEKVHGTSGRTGKHLREIQLPEQSWMVRAAAWVWGWGLKAMGRSRDFTYHNWEKVSGTRRVVKDYESGDELETGFYSSDQFRRDAHDLINPRQGETWYYELVGWSGAAPIMATHSPAKITDKTLRKEVERAYGSSITYSYGQTPGTCEIYIYKITQMTPDGHEVTLDDASARARTAEAGLKFVPKIRTFIFDGNVDKLVAWCNEQADGPSLLDESHPREGLCFKVEHPEFRKVMKWKGFTFSVMEEIRYSDPDFVDAEEVE